MNGVAHLPKHASDDSEGVPASSNWMKQQWWKYSSSAQKASPPPRFLLVVLLSAQILFLAVVRLGPSASAWGLGARSTSEALSLSLPFFKGNAGNISHVFLVTEETAAEESKATISRVSLESEDLEDEESKVVINQVSVENEDSVDEESKTPDDMLTSDDSLSASSEERSVDPSSSSSSLPGKTAHPKWKPNRKGKASYRKVWTRRSIPKKKKRGEVASLLQHKSENTFNAALQSTGNKAEVGERNDDQLPFVDDKLVVDRARSTQKNDSPLDTSLAMVSKQDDEGTNEVGSETTPLSSIMKAQTSHEVKDVHAENTEKENEEAAVVEAQAAMEEALSGENMREHASLLEEKRSAEAPEKGEEQASSAEKGSEVVSNNVDDKAQVKPNDEGGNVPEKVGSVKEELALAEQVSVVTSSAACKYGYIYVYDLLRSFNHDIISNCSALNPWLDVCSTLANGGLGNSLGEASPLGQIGSWFTTDQFTAEILFHNRILQHQCLTDQMDKAAGFYVPFYAGLDVGRYLWEGASAERRDRLSNQFLDWLSEQPAWKKSGGSDHFMMIGRITWDFRRSRDEHWGSSFFHKPAMQKITKLLIERNPWDVNEMGVPYPTNFHPQSDVDLVAWQNHIRGLQRSNLFSFAGAPRERFSDDFRSILFEQCRQAEHCGSLDCSNRICDDNQKTLELFKDSIFCLQPRGDSFTRRSTFDCLLAGSIPVFFWHRTAYMQYKWHLPVDETDYSVFISKEDMRNGTKIEDVLKAFSPEKVRSMQEAVIQLVPKIVYAASGFSLHVNDAFDVAIDGVMKGFKEMSLSSER